MLSDQRKSHIHSTAINRAVSPESVSDLCHAVSHNKRPWGLNHERDTSIWLLASGGEAVDRHFRMALTIFMIRQHG
jgi:hypothetical protein